MSLKREVTEYGWATCCENGLVKRITPRWRPSALTCRSAYGLDYRVDYGLSADVGLYMDVLDIGMSRSEDKDTRRQKTEEWRLDYEYSTMHYN